MTSVGLSIREHNFAPGARCGIQSGARGIARKMLAAPADRSIWWCGEWRRPPTPVFCKHNSVAGRVRDSSPNKTNNSVLRPLRLAALRLLDTSPASRGGTQRMRALQGAIRRSWPLPRKAGERDRRRRWRGHPTQFPEVRMGTLPHPDRFTVRSPHQVRTGSLHWEVDGEGWTILQKQLQGISVAGAET